MSPLLPFSPKSSHVVPCFFTTTKTLTRCHHHQSLQSPILPHHHNLIVLFHQHNTNAPHNHQNVTPSLHGRRQRNKRTDTGNELLGGFGVIGLCVSAVVCGGGRRVVFVHGGQWWERGWGDERECCVVVLLSQLVAVV
ncbi:hypothetical protein ACFE04_020821 [Oxalis oulophora]